MRNRIKPAQWRIAYRHHHDNHKNSRWIAIKESIESNSFRIDASSPQPQTHEIEEGNQLPQNEHPCVAVEKIENVLKIISKFVNPFLRHHKHKVKVHLPVQLELQEEDELQNEGFPLPWAGEGRLQNHLLGQDIQLPIHTGQALHQSTQGTSNPNQHQTFRNRCLPRQILSVVPLNHFPNYELKESNKQPRLQFLPGEDRARWATEEEIINREIQLSDLPAERHRQSLLDNKEWGECQVHRSVPSPCLLVHLWRSQSHTGGSLDETQNVHHDDLNPLVLRNQNGE